MNLQIDLMQAGHLPGVLRVQAIAYRDIVPESDRVMIRKWELAPDCCFVCLADGEVHGYVLAHPWHADRVPELHGYLEQLPEAAESFYLHDLALHPALRGKRLASALFDAARQAALRRRFRRSHLIAVQHSVPFWQKQGYWVWPVQQLRTPEKLASYGTEATLMGQEWA